MTEVTGGFGSVGAWEGGATIPVAEGPMSESGFFKAAVKLPPDRRAAYLDQACGSDAELRAEIESLLHAHDASGSFLKDVPAGPDPTED